LGVLKFNSFKNESIYCSNAILSANKFIRKMKGGSQSILVQANDSRYYVVKLADNPQGANILANEALGSVIVQTAGLPVAEGKGICLTDRFIDDHLDLWFEHPEGNRRPNKGMHFASLFVGQPSGQERPTEYISPSRINMITNREAFLGMYILDVWANHKDNRQAILRKSTKDCSQEVFFIDHGHMFGGPEWDLQSNPGASFHLEKAVYADLWQDEDVASWISHFQTVIPPVLSCVIGCIAPQWYKGNIDALLGCLADRLGKLSELVDADATKNWQVIQQKIKNEPMRLSDSGIHDLRTSDARSALPRDPSVACA
jgi:hypothetical protein